MSTMRLVWCGLAALALAGGACGGGQVIDRHPDAGGVDADTWSDGFHVIFNQDVSRNVDILFLIDNSSEVIVQQQKLRRDFPTLVSTLQSLPGGMPNVHIGVVSSDMGAGDGSISGCSAVPPNGYGGNKGIFQYGGNIIPPATTPCATGLNPGATFISNVGGVANYTGALADAFGCISSIGESGCGFEHHFAAILRALGADDLGPAPAENAGFLRVDADLAIVMLTNEDDCSVPPGVPLFDTKVNTNLMSQLGPPANFRCNEFGHLCPNGNGELAHPGRFAPNNNVNATVAYVGCESNDNEGFLLSAKDTAARIKQVKSHPPRVVTSQILVASIQGPATPYVVHWKAPSTLDTSCGMSSCPWPEMTHSCATQTAFADPGVRTQEFVQQFGDAGLVLSVCDDSYAPGLQQLGAAIGRLFDPPCLGQRIKDNPLKPGLQPDCRVTGHIGSSESAADTPVSVPLCDDTGGVGPCWAPTRQQASCNGGFSVQYTRDPRAPNAIYVLTVDCPTCAPGVDDPAGCI